MSTTNNSSTTLPVLQTVATTTIQLTRGYVTVVDTIDSDFAKLKWFAYQSHGILYARRNSPNRKTLHLHRVILIRMLGRDLADSEYCDHINGDGLDNRRSNLRLATHAENECNQRRHSNNTSGYKGVSLHKATQKWRASISINGIRKHLGLFDTAQDAYGAYCEAALKLHGEFARFE